MWRRQETAPCHVSGRERTDWCLRLVSTTSGVWRLQHRGLSHVEPRQLGTGEPLVVTSPSIHHATVVWCPFFYTTIRLSYLSRTFSLCVMVGFNLHHSWYFVKIFLSVLLFCLLVPWNKDEVCFVFLCLLNPSPHLNIVQTDSSCYLVTTTTELSKLVMSVAVFSDMWSGSTRTSRGVSPRERRPSQRGAMWRQQEAGTSRILSQGSVCRGRSMEQRVLVSGMFSINSLSICILFIIILIQLLCFFKYLCKTATFWDLWTHIRSRHTSYSTYFVFKWFNYCLHGFCILLYVNYSDL